MDEFYLKKITSDFDTIIMLDLNSGNIELSQCRIELKDRFSEMMADGYDKYRQRFCRKFLFPEDYEWIMEKTSTSSIKTALEKDPVVLINYRLKTSDDQVKFYQTKIARVEDSDDFSKVIIGGHSIDQVERQSLKYLEEVATAHHNAVIASLASDFDYICYINRKTRHVRRFYASEVFKKIISTIDTSLRSYDKLISFFKMIVYEEDYEQFTNDIEATKVHEQLQMLPSYEVYFRVKLENQLFYYKLKFINDSSDPDGVILGLQSFDEQIRTRIQHREKQQAHDLMEKQLEIVLTERTAEIQEKNKVLNRINEDIIEMLGDVTEARDIESGEHIHRVKGFTQILANQIMVDWPEYELNNEKIDLIVSASPLHDIGKISIPDAILLKPGKLTPDEFEIMKTHTTRGCEILKKAPKDWSPAYLETSMEICHFHHEKYDGSGYPLGLKGDTIPISAQIVSLADCYDALTSKRVYKDAFASDTSYKMIMDGKCGGFNPKLLTSFTNCFPHLVQKEFEQVHIEYGVSNHIVENLSGKLILYVEDESLTRTIGREMLEGEGAVVIEATSGKEALSIFGAASKGAFDAIMLDIYLPDMNGIDITKIIRSMDNDYAKTIPIVALTASKNKGDLNLCLENGMNAYLTKPVSVSNLTSVLMRLIKNK